MLCSVVVDAELLNGFDGSVELVNRGLFNDALCERIPVSECSRRKAVFVDA